MKLFNIAGFVTALDFGCDELIDPSFAKFAYTDGMNDADGMTDEADSSRARTVRDRDLIFRLSCVIPDDGQDGMLEDDDSSPEDDRARQEDPLLVSSDYYRVYDLRPGYRLEYETGGLKISALTYDDGSRTDIIVYDPEKRPMTGMLYEDSALNAKLKEQLFYAVRDCFFLFCLKKGRLAVHSSSIIYGDRAYLFSARSGTGKTTHTDFWVDRYGAEILDGDVALLEETRDGVFAWGLPWCGSSGKCKNAKVQLGAVVFLSRGEENRAGACSPFEAAVNLIARSFAPNWNAELAGLTADNAQRITGRAGSGRFLTLECLPEADAAQTMKEYIDLNCS